MRKYLILLILILITGFLGWGIYLPKEPLSKKEVTFNIEKGKSLRDIAFNLEKEDLIKNKIFFKIYVLLKGKYRNLQAGEYFLSPKESVAEIAKKIISGDVVKEEITIIEGWNLRDIGFYLEGRAMFQAEELWEVAGFPAVDYSKARDLPIPLDFSSDYDFLKEKSSKTGLEGYLFPDTYWIRKGASIEEIVRKMLDNFGKKLTPQLREKISQQDKSIFEIVTMASLLEKEVDNFEDRQIISGILWKRLENDIPLQIDATITYITGKRTVKISKEETQIDSPYNTYKYKGLPLGPICSPGLESIITAVYPEDSEYWYYLSLPSGKTIFSKTLEEHNIAKAKYLK